MPTIWGRNYQLQELKSLWAPIYEATLDLIGTTGVILPIGDPDQGQPIDTTFTTVGEEQVVFTWSEAPSAFDTGLDLTSKDSYQGIVPFVTLNGTDEYASSADAAYWSRVESGSEKFSFAMWINLELGTGTPSLFTKYDGLGGQSEYLLRLTGNENFSILLADDVDNKFAARTTDAALSASVWHQIAITYDSGASGASVAANDITIYLDGAVIASTAANDADYSGMVAGTYAVGLGVDSTTGTPARFFDGKIAGGPCGPLFTHILLSADAIKRIFQLQRKPLGV